MSVQFDVIVVGSGITGGWAAKELTESGLKVLMIERGRAIEHIKDYETEFKSPWEMPFRGMGDAQVLARDYSVQSHISEFDEWTTRHFVNDREHPYQTDVDAPFNWIRGYQLGGRSLTWGRQSYRWSDIDFGANAKDGHGTDWPIRYQDLASWYDHVEDFIGVSGSSEGLPQLPDGKFQTPMALNVVEKYAKQKIEHAMPDRKLIIGRVANLTEPKKARGVCQNRSICARGCSFGAYFSTQSSTLPAAKATGNLTVLTDTVVNSVDYDPLTRRATGVKVTNTVDRTSATYTAGMVFLCASAFNSVAVLLRSTCEHFPHGLANHSGVLGKFIMDHANAPAAIGSIPGFQSHTTFGNRPTGIIIPRFRNIEGSDPRFTRGYSYQGGAYQRGWPRGESQAGLGASYKASLREPGPWMFALMVFGECLPRAENQVTLEPRKTDSDGLSQLRIRMVFGENEHALLSDAAVEAKAMLAAVGGTLKFSSSTPGTPGTAVHEMGGARMGRDRTTSVLNAHNQAHDIPNLFVTDGACMASSACQNPSLTYMALTARAAAYAAGQFKAGKI